MIPASKSNDGEKQQITCPRELAVGASHGGTCGLSLRSWEEESILP